MRIVSLDLPTSWSFAAPTDEFTGRVFQAINGMMLDVLAAAARKDYDDRRRRQAQGQARAKAAGLYKGRPEDKARNEAIASMLRRSRHGRRSSLRLLQPNDAAADRETHEGQPGTATGTNLAFHLKEKH